MSNDAERAEAERLEREIDSLERQIENTLRRIEQLKGEIAETQQMVAVSTKSAEVMGTAVDARMHTFALSMNKLDLDVGELFAALKELSDSYFIYKNLSTATKLITQYTDEYHTRFRSYNRLRRITLGYVVGVDAQICSSETLRKEVEQAYLQNTEYWLAYCIMATMLWVSNEREAANRSMRKALAMDYPKSALYFLLVHLRFGRQETAKKWYIQYLSVFDENNAGSDWQYLLEACLCGAFGQDPAFETTVKERIVQSLVKLQGIHPQFGMQVAQKATAFAETYPHTTEFEYVILKRICGEYGEIIALLSAAEKNARLAEEYEKLYAESVPDSKDLGENIENVLYALISSYDSEELKVVQRIRYNECIVKAKGNIGEAQAYFNTQYADNERRAPVDELLVSYAFDAATNRTQPAVRRFAVSTLEKNLKRGFEDYASRYREKERKSYTYIVDGCKLTGDENDGARLAGELDAYYDKKKMKEIMSDKPALIYMLLCLMSLATLTIMIFAYALPALIIGIMLGLVGSFLLWRRIVDVLENLKEKRRRGQLTLKNALEELRQWRARFRQEDAKHVRLLDAVEAFAL